MVVRSGAFGAGKVGYKFKQAKDVIYTLLTSSFYISNQDF